MINPKWVGIGATFATTLVLVTLSYAKGIENDSVANLKMIQNSKDIEELKKVVESLAKTVNKESYTLNGIALIVTRMEKKLDRLEK